MSSLIAPQFSIVSRRTVRGTPQNCRESAFFFCVRHCEFIGFASRGILSCWMVLLLPPVHQTGWGRCGKKQAQLQGNTKEATTFTVAFSMDRGPLDMLVQIVHAGKTDAVLPEQPWPERTHHVIFRQRLGHDDHDPAARGHSGQHSEPAQRRAVVDPPLGHGQRPRQRGHPGRHAGHIPSRRARLPPTTKHVVPAALRRGRLPQLQELHSEAGDHDSCPRSP